MKTKDDAMTGTWTILQHVAWEGPGLIATEAQARGLHPDIRRLDLGAGVPQPDDVEGLVVMGGPMGVYETHKHPFLAEECNLIAELVRRNRPVLGVCLGAQLLAQALGARVFPGPRPEIGFGRVDLTAEGQQDPLFAPLGPSIAVFHWHGDTFELPDGAVLLATSAMYLHQAFRIGPYAYGLQFHVEPNSATWDAWRGHLPEDLVEQSAARRSIMECVGRDIIGRFLDLSPPGRLQSVNGGIPASYAT